MASQCTLAWGACNHQFHLHCINRWLKRDQLAPWTTDLGRSISLANKCRQTRGRWPFVCRLQQPQAIMYTI